VAVPSPHDRAFSQKVNRKMYQGAMRAIVSELARLERLTVIDLLALEAPKTRLLAAKLRELDMKDVLVLIEAYDEKLDLASRNLRHVSVLPVSAVDPVSLVRHERVLATVGAVRMLEEKLA
jgi:large subunit ribosomal protein L4